MHSSLLPRPRLTLQLLPLVELPLVPLHLPAQPPMPVQLLPLLALILPPKLHLPITTNPTVPSQLLQDP
jgi:hypothetical protein